MGRVPSVRAPSCFGHSCPACAGLRPAKIRAGHHVVQLRSARVDVDVIRPRLWHRQRDFDVQLAPAARRNVEWCELVESKQGEGAGATPAGQQGPPKGRGFPHRGCDDKRYRRALWIAL